MNPSPCEHLDFGIVVEVLLCGELGPVLPGLGLRYACTRPARVCAVVHEAWAGGRLLDSWPHELGGAG